MKSKLTICITYIDSKIKQKYLMNPFFAFSLCQDINNWNKEYHLIYFCVFCFIIILWSLFTKYNITFSKVFLILRMFKNIWNDKIQWEMTFQMLRFGMWIWAWLLLTWYFINGEWGCIFHVIYCFNRVFLHTTCYSISREFIN